VFVVHEKAETELIGLTKRVRSLEEDFETTDSRLINTSTKLEEASKAADENERYVIPFSPRCDYTKASFVRSFILFLNKNSLRHTVLKTGARKTGAISVRLVAVLFCAENMFRVICRSIYCLLNILMLREIAAGVVWRRFLASV